MIKKVSTGILAIVLVFAIFPTSALAVERHEVLQIGDEDNWVYELQEKLNDLGYLQVSATGYFGTNTQNALLQYQTDKGLVSDGKAGPLTRKELFGSEYKEIDSSRNVTNQPAASQPEQPVQEENKKAAGSIDTTTAISPGDKGDEIAKIQTRLKELEYYEYSSITGYYGPVTQDSVKKFQRTNGLSPDGIMDTTSLALLNSDSVKYYTMYPGDSGDDIQKMQERLKELGFFSGTATGYYGNLTLEAVQAFQSAQGLVVDGKAGKNTRKILFSGDAVQGNKTAEQQPAKQETTKPAQAPKSEPAAQPQPVADAPSGDIQRLIDTANTQLGKPYSYGSNGPSSYDCSGFVYYTMKNAGFATSRLSSAGYANVSNWTSVGDVGSLNVGDLVFFKSDKSSVISHVGIYLGGGSFIHSAPSSGGVSVSTMSSGYYERNFVSAKRFV